MRRTRDSRRRALAAMLGITALVALVLVAASVVLRDGETRPPAAASFHPVAGSFEPDDTTLADCSEDRCFEQAFGNLAYYEGPRSAIALFDRTLDQGDPSCHRIAHAIGAAALARYRGNVARTFAEGSSSCFSGYYHGVLERALVRVETRDAKRLGGIARELCDDPQVRVTMSLAYQCFHGLGHGLMITTGYLLPLSLEACERIATHLDRMSCKSGIFMENITSSYGVRSQWLRDDDPIYPCNAVELDDKITCYGMVTSRILRVVGLDWDKVAEICSEVESRFVKTCFRSLGRDISGQTHRDPDEILELCAVARPYAAESVCVTAGAMDMVSNYSRGTEAAGLCDSAPVEFQADCYFGIGGVMGRLRTTVAEREADCREIASLPANVAACIRGTEVKGSLNVALGR